MITLAVSRTPLAKLRLVATLPPKRFFGGNNLIRARDQIAALKDLGAAVNEFDTEPVYARNNAEIDRQKREIIELSSTCRYQYAECRLCRARRDGGEDGDHPEARRNIFIDDLRLPVVLYWDHALTQAAWYPASLLPDQPWQSSEGALNIIRTLFLHPRVAHFFPDGGHINALKDFLE